MRYNNNEFECLVSLLRCSFSCFHPQLFDFTYLDFFILIKKINLLLYGLLKLQYSPYYFLFLFRCLLLIVINFGFFSMINLLLKILKSVFLISNSNQFLPNVFSSIKKNISEFAIIGDVYSPSHITYLVFFFNISAEPLSFFTQIFYDYYF